ncbi:potassium channel subfamily K member 18 isoform X2 [Neocloeon triangulifer]|uniref:potassium channel subfamily K member 18 isoform X2 n=1 Tax=Neocloeon triangulifer TaxID=2078957 RepID=UPI00286F06A1|nr:potassium channel subfamily K member 18 isoform X2 [Neocloeon triangulifer]
MRNNVPIEEDEPGKCCAFWYCVWKVFTCICSHFILISMVVSYCIMGAYTFQALEAKNEVARKVDIKYKRSNCTDRLWQLTQESDVLRQENWTERVIVELKEFEKDLLTAMKKHGWDGTENEEANQWTFSGALFYSIIVITTIGYGHIAPKTHWGKVVTIFYAILGIPLMLLCLSNIGDVMAHSFRFIYWKVCCYVCTRKPKRSHRRGRSARGGTIRQHSSGGAKSRSASFRRSARTSQRSADSALGLSDSVMTRSSYSDNEFRYDDTGMELVQHPQNLQKSRGVDATLQVQQPSMMAMGPQLNQPLQQAAQGGQNPPVLFNRYIDDASQQQQQQGWRNKGRPGVELDALPAGRGDSVKSTASLPNPIPSPTGPLPGPPTGRYQRQGSSRLGRLREDPEMMDEFMYVYESEPEIDDTPSKPVPIWLCVFLVVSYIFGGAFLFAEWEKWEFLDSAYFCFITLTTIGFGDFVPAQRKEKAEISIALCSLYLLFGIALLAMSFNLVQEQVINSVKSVARRLGIIKDENEDED